MDRIGKLRLIYGLALALLATVLMTMLFDSWSLAKLERLTVPLFLYAIYALTFLPFAAPLMVLMLRPMAWGRLLLPFYGFGWVMHGAALALKGSPVPLAGLCVEIACGAVMVALAVANHLIVLRSPHATAAEPG